VPDGLASRSTTLRYHALMQPPLMRGVGAALAVGYAVFIGWLYLRQPQTVADVTGALSATVGIYRIDQQAFADGLDAFRREQFAAARSAFQRADPAQQDATTQFYVAYSYYREGWGRLYQDDQLFAQGLETINRALARAPAGRIVVEDSDLQMRSGDELKAELESGLRREASDFNPARILRPRK
jgi:hypothetical protein